MKANFRDYQLKGVDWLLDHPRSALYWLMGTGKTLTTATAIQIALDACLVRRVLVVAPPRVARNVWPAELKKWDHTRHLSYRVITGHGWRTRIKEDDSDIHIIGYDILASRELRKGKDIKVLPGVIDLFGRQFPYEWVVLDESARVKNPSSERFKALRRAVRLYPRVTELSGIPAPRCIHDLWSQTYLLDRGERLYPRLGQFRARWFSKHPAFYSFSPKPGAAEEISGRVKDLAFSLTSSEVMDLPPQIVNDIKVSLPSKAERVYREMERDAFTALGAQKVIPATTAADVVNKLLQISNGAVYVTQEDQPRITEHIHDAKLDALESVLEEDPDENILVAYKFQSDLERIKKRFPFSVDIKDGDKVLDQWNKGEIRMLTINPAGNAEGLNLQYGGRVIVFFSLTWNYGDYQQVIERIGPTRQAQSGLNRTVFVHRIVAENTVDEDVINTLEGRQSLQELVIEKTRRFQNENG